MLDFHHSAVREEAARMTCATCGMTLAVPGIIAGGRSYCCHGCAPGEDGRPRMMLKPPVRSSIEVARAVHIAAPRERVEGLLGDLELLRLYEQKLGTFEITAISADGKTACAMAHGQFGLLPYYVEFHIKAGGGGYESTLCSAGPVVGLRGTFESEEIEGGTLVTHVESYEMKGGVFGRAIGRLVKPFLEWSLERELRVLKTLIEDPAALGEALRIGDSRRIPVDPAIAVFDPQAPTKPVRGRVRRVPTPYVAGLSVALIAGGITGALISRALASRR